MIHKKLLCILLLITCSIHCQAADKDKVVIHVASNDVRTMQGAIAGARILQNQYGKNKITIEIVANNLGISLVNSRSKYASQVTGLLKDGIKFSACNHTINLMRMRNEAIHVVDGVSVVPFGLVRVFELQKQGYMYIRP